MATGNELVTFDMVKYMREKMEGEIDALSTDETLSIEGRAADAAAVGVLKTGLSEISGDTRNLITGKLSRTTIESNGTYWSTSSTSTDVFYAPVEQNKVYVVTTNDPSGLLSCAFYTSEPKTSMQSYNSSRTIQASKIITAPIDGYIAFRTATGYEYAQIEEGTHPTPYIKPFTAIDRVARETIDDLNTDILCSGNVFDSANVVEGYRVGGSQGSKLNVIEDANACYYSLPVIGENGSLIISFVGFPYWYLGDSFGLLVKASNSNIYTPVYGNRKGIDSRTFTGSWTETNKDMILYINCTIADKDKLAVYINKVVKQYTPYNGVSFSVKNSPLYGKKMCCNGDSIMYGAGATGGFASIIADIYNMTLQNIAVSGGTIASGTLDNNTNRHWIAETMSNLFNDGDYYIIEGGVNDYSVNVPMFPPGQSAVRTNIKTTYPSDLTNFTDAMEAICYSLVVNHTGKKLGFVFCHKLSYLDWTSNSESKTFMAYKNAQKEILKKWGIPFIDLSEVSGMDTIFDSIASAYTANSDRYHPNQRGYEQFYVPHIIKWMEQL